MMVYRIRFIFFVVTFIFPATICLAQPIPNRLVCKHLTKEQGLSSSIVLDFITLDNGKMLIGTWGGLNIFDSNKNIQIPSLTHQKQGMSNDRITGFVKDKKGDIWFGTEALVQFDQKTNKYTSHFITYVQSKAYNDFLIPFYVDDCGLIWLFAGKHQKPITFDPKTEKFDTTGIKLGDFTQNVVQKNKLYEAVDTIWSYSQNETGIKRSYFKDGRRVVETLFNGKNGFPNLTSVIHIKYHKDNLWIACNEGLIKYHIHKNQWKIFNQFGRQNLREFRTLDFMGDWVWVGTFTDGLLLFDNKQEKFIRQWKHNPDDPGSISTNKIETLKTDSSGNLWISTLFSGLDWCNVFTPQFSYFKIDNPDDQINNIRMTEDIDGNLWYATNANGLRVWDTKSKKIIRSFNKTNSPFKNLNINDLYRDKYNNIWISTSKGLFQYNYVDDKLILISHPDKEDQFFFCSELKDKGLYCLNQKNMVWLEKKENVWLVNSVDIYHPPRKVEFSYNSNFSSLPDDEIILWTEDSVSIYKFESPLQLKFSKAVDFPFGYTLGNTIPFNQSIYFCFRKKLMKFNYKLKKLDEEILSTDDIKNSGFTAMVMDKTNQIWAGSKSGLWWLNKEGKKKKFTVNDGLLSDEFYENLGLLSKNGDIIFGTTSGLVKFDPSHFSSKKETVKLLLDKMEVNYKSYPSVQNVENWEKLHLPYHENSLAFYLSVIDFQRSSNHFIEYQLEGYENNAVQVDNPAIIRFPNLPPGDYTLRIQILNINKDVVSPAYFLTFQIKSPWYQTWWFLTLLAGSIMGLFWYFMNLRTQKLLLNQRIILEKEQLINAERSRIARDMHDDLGSGLSAINLLSNFLKNEKLDENSYKQIEKIASSSTELNQKLREIVWSMNPGHDYIQNLGDFIRRYIHDLQDIYKKINFSFIVTESLPDINIPKMIQKELFLCVKEAVHNAIKHSGSDVIDVSMSVNNNTLILRITDQGKGFDTSMVDTSGGNGIKNIRERMFMINGSINFFLDKGHTVELTYTLPK